ncbi:uncharacterized protein [Lolium perenne]|uniref:uncharacterized protein isoform X3 n=1 Tax=Lolium perenne TaxID=4522 RepID=UPI0021F6868C|nr:uncharacterized protein LOC127340673 isoform X3 [Lolium perenne]
MSGSNGTTVQDLIPAPRMIRGRAVGRAPGAGLDNRQMESDILVHILDGREKPTNLPFSLLKNITGNFSEDRVVGQGGFAIVYKGVLPNGSVAVKRIRNNHSIDEKLFYREVDSLLTINHQNVVRFLGFCASTEHTAIKIEGSSQHIYAEIRERLLCFEYISNGSLKNHITDELRGLEWNTRYQIIMGICEGLHHLHKEKHIYHMDLKPANILLDNQMRPKITDFGLSRLDEKSETMSEGRCGSLGYCAPEYLWNGKMSFKSDMFSLGIVIIELLTGEKGIPDNNKNNVLRKWRHRWKKTGNETPLIYQQVAKCMEIGLLCQEIDPSKRPFVWDMIHDIREMEGANGKFSDACGYTFGQISPYSEDDMLGVEPLKLHFPFEINKQISCSLKLTNQTDAYIAFNIQKMSPLPYCMQPNKGIVPPQSKCSVDVTLHPQDMAPRDMQRADEFIVWSTKVNSLSAEDITINMFNKESGVVDAMNLDVVFHTEESTIVSKELILHSITEDMSNIKIDGTVGDVKKSQEYLLPTALWMSSTGSHDHREAEKESSEPHETSEKTSEVLQEKVKESQYQITPWQTELPNKTSLPSKNSLDIVPQAPYPHVQSPMSSPVQCRGDWSVLANKNGQVIPSEDPARNTDHDYRERTSLSSSNQFRNDVSTQASQHDSHTVQFDLDTQSQNPPFKGLSRSDVLDGSVGAEAQHVRETSAQWGPGDSPNLASVLEEVSSHLISYPYLPTIPEEPGSPFSYAAEDDPLPGIIGLRITGEGFPGRELQASGYSIYGTTTCFFKWARHLEDGSVIFIEGATQPNYLVTADDVDTLLVVEVHPLDDRNRQGDVVKVYANNQAKITCDPETKELIKRTLEARHVSYQVQLPVRYMWEPAVLAINREGYGIKCNGRRGVVCTENFLQARAINIPSGYDRATEFVIVSASGEEYHLQPAENTPPRDTIVLVLRLFRSMAVKKKRGWRKGLVFQ